MKKKEMLAMVAEMDKANDDCRNQNKAVSVEELAQCQQTAITLGSELEKRGERGEQLMHMLEEYCEYIWQLGTDKGDATARRKLTKKIRQQLSRVKNAITYDLPDDKKEIVFLPYKASMWDSLESIWLAAKEDDTCETFVIPIPYCDKNPDGSIKQWHCEAGEYPDYVPVTPWEEYDIAERKPDIIFFHNPYDEYNYVTGVHPKYYSSELKKHTDKLVYVPYFVALNDVSEHFITVPGVVNADYVIVQSEKVKETYARVFIDFMGKQQKELEERTGQVNREFWKRLRKTADEKFLPLGSPKIDKAVNTKREDVSLPEEWERLIVREDGTRKKVILYNTTIDALLKNREAYIKKLQSVLEEFKENREAVLWWRPHPLLQSTLDSMIPRLSDDYRRIVRQYREAGRGIYDDTADLNRSIAVSDAYYGDWSSVVALYRETGKPVMIQNTDEAFVLGEDMRRNDAYILYGAGVVAYETYNAVLSLYGRKPACVVVSEKNGIDGKGMPEGMDIRTPEEVDAQLWDYPVVIAAPEPYHDEIRSVLRRYPANNIYCVTSHLEYMLTGEYFRKNGRFLLAEDLRGIEETPKPDAVRCVRVYMAKSHKDVELKNLYEIPKWIKPIQAGYAVADADLGILRDDTGENISVKNADYCELTVTYWVWKNVKSRYKGVCHYRRMLILSENQLERCIAQDVDAILPLPFTCYPDASGQYRRYISGADCEGLKKALRDVSPEYLEEWEKLDSQPYFYNYNMLIAKENVFDSYCGWLFSVLERAEIYCRQGGAERGDRYAGYLGELLTTLYFMKNSDSLKIVHAERNWMV